MNDRLRELVFQCWDERLDGRHFDQEQFARLIIEESIRVMKQHDYHAEWLGEKIKQHFGLEE